jgi:CubicO group peptidase (beta-lactamase class C family)
MTVRTGLILGGLLVLAAGVATGFVWQHHRGRQAALSVLVQGGDGGGLPLATLADEHFDGAALERAVADPAAAGLQAFVVMRHGHVVFARYGRGYSADRVVDSGAFARVLVALAAGVAVDDGTLTQLAPSGFDPAQLRAAIERGAHQSYAAYLSRVLWRRLNAAPARITLPAAGAAVPADCCFQARLQDWMRIGALLVNDGSFEDTQVIPRGWVAHMRAPINADGLEGMGLELPSHAPAARAFDAADLMFLRGNGHWRLWVVPSLKLVVLFGAAGDAGGSDSAWDETRLPNLVVEAITDRPPAPAGSLLQQLVHGH